MELTLDQIHTYLQCPTTYYFKYVQGEAEEESESIRYKKTLHKTIDYFYYNLMNGRMVSLKQMKDKFSALWVESGEAALTLENHILKERKPIEAGRPEAERRRTSKRVVQGMEAIHNFYHFNKEKHGIPIAVNHDFRVPIGGVTVTGKFELIRETLDNSSPNRFIEIVDFKTGTEATDLFLVRNDLNLSVMSYAFRNLFQAREDRLTYNYLKSGKEIYTGRGEKEFRRMQATIEGVAEGIANQRFYPRQTFMCKSCPFKKVCNDTHF